jgi:orotidine-5'-phosphate decarboxylase
VTHPASRRLIVALDFDSLDAAYAFAKPLVGLVGLLKIGKQLFTAEGPDAVRQISALGVGIFLDLKYHDIPNTVNGALRAAASLPGIQLVNVHTLGGPVMMRSAAETLAPIPNRPKLLGVTILTSMDAKQMGAVGISGTPAKRALALAKLAKKSGLDGVVASAHEVKALRKACGKDFILAIGGIRPELQAGQQRVRMVNGPRGRRDDQSRIATPGAAIRAGATYLIVGRPINAAPDPVAAAHYILDEIAKADSSLK